MSDEFHRGDSERLYYGIPVGGSWEGMIDDCQFVDTKTPTRAERHRWFAGEVWQRTLRLKPGESFEVKCAADGAAEWIVTYPKPEEDT